ncbi:MAG: tetratricopeptide repeat protein [Lachnospiraceae bacterium]
MDRYEYKLKLDEIRKKLSEGKIDEAAQIVDSINWKKVRMVSALCLAGEVYEKAHRYEESKAMLREAYDRSPIGRTIVYRLALVAVKSGDIDEAEEYYDEFVGIAPTDNMRYILKYQIAQAKGASVAELISILEEFKERESSERWTYELAALYHKAGMAGKCVDLCDELILWYGEGKFVEKALELKMLYQPLTAEQEKKFRRIKQNRSGKVEVNPDDELMSGEILSEARVIPQVEIPSPTFNTVNLQQELAENMKKIMEATEKETVSSHMEQIKELVNTIPYLKIPEENKLPEEDDRFGHIETDEEIDGSLKIDFQEMLAEEQGGQMSLQVPEQPTFEKQITGQMSIEEVLKEWEKTKQAAQAAMEVAEQKRLESAKARALKEAENIMDRLQDVIPQLEAGKTPQQLMEEQYTKKLDEIPEDEIEYKEPDLREEEGAFGEPDYEEEESAYEESDLKEEKDTYEEPEADEESIEEPRDAAEEDDEPDTEEEEEKPHRITFLTDKQKEYFAYFLKVDGMEKQLCQTMDAMIRNHLTGNSSTGNLIIEGGRGSGKTALALDLIKALHTEQPSMGQRVGKIKASVLNQKNILSLMGKVRGGYLIIEKAGDLNRDTAEALALAMEGAAGGVTVIMEDTAAGLRQAMAISQSLTKKFDQKITIPVFTSDELVHFAKSYAQEAGYEIEEIAILALYKRISNIQKVDRATYVAEVKEIMDEAMNRASKGGLTKAFRKKHTEEGKIIIHEKDFE